MNVDTEQAWEWAQLLRTAARYFDKAADSEQPGSLRYSEFLNLSERCSEAAEYVSDAASIEDEEIDEAVQAALRAPATAAA